jgi:hypothetical protein
MSLNKQNQMYLPMKERLSREKWDLPKLKQTYNRLNSQNLCEYFEFN